MAVATTPTRPRFLRRVDPVRAGLGLVGSSAVVGVVAMATVVAIDSAKWRSIVVPISEKKGFPSWLQGPLETFHGDRLLADPYGRLMIGMFAAYVLAVVVARWVPLPLIACAVGFLAVISAKLAAAGISCNVFSAVHHDHLFVPHGRGREAVELLRMH